VIRRLYGSAVIAATLRGQKELPFRPREEIERRRDARVRWIARYAVKHVPFYAGLDAERVRTAADLERWPRLDRDHVRAHPDQYVARTRAARNALELTTSGTSGRPLRMLHDRRSVLRNMAWGERERAPLIAMTGAGFRPKELYVAYAASTLKRVTDFYAQATLMPVRPRRRFVDVRSPLEEIAALTLAERPDILTGAGGWMDLFFRTVTAYDIPFHRPSLVIYGTEALPYGARELIEGLGIPVMSRYNAVESFKIGFFCEERTGFHLHDDLCVVRTDDEGRILLSNLVNRATVLLNYPVGDLGAMSDEPCPCGRNLRLLGELEGRVEDILTLPDGRLVHPREVWGIFKHDRSVLQYQLVQHAPDRYTLHLATTDPAARDRGHEGLRRLLGPGAAIEVTDPPPPDGRKFRAVVAAPTARGTAADRAPTTPPGSADGAGTAR
jgi:phenylacetate-CoA ligase